MAAPSRRLVSVHQHSDENDPFVEANITETSVLTKVNKKIRVAKAQAEIDRILSSPDGPFDPDTELQRVVSVVKTAPEVENASDQLEADLYRAVHQEDYETAAQKRRAMDELHMDDALAVLQVNSAYYKAFSAKDLEHMKSLWLPDASTVCIHPGVDPVVGYNDIMESWQALFRQPGMCLVESRNIRIVVRGATTAIITCDEVVSTKRPFIRGAPRPGKPEPINTLQTTNLFRRVAGQWYLAHHHASWHANSRVGRLALDQASKVQKPNDGVEQTSETEDETAQVQLDGILGINNFNKPVLRDENRKSNTQSGGIEDIVSRAMDGLQLDDIIGQAMKDVSQGGGSRPRVIHIQRFGSNKNNDSEDEDDEDEDEDDEGEDNLGSLRRFSKIPPRTGMWTTTTSNESSSSPPKSMTQTIQKQRQNCISVLRELAIAGTISRLHKRVLLSDIITCVARRERSLVEVAYELLCGGGKGDLWEEDFAEQCRAFADELLEED